MGALISKVSLNLRYLFCFEKGYAALLYWSSVVVIEIVRCAKGGRPYRRWYRGNVIIGIGTSFAPRAPRGLRRR